MSTFWRRFLGWRLRLAGLALVAAFAVLTGRFWHPHYGFTKFVQLDEADQRTAIPEIRAHPVFAYRGFNGYDGAAYTQLAFHPLLDSSALQPALDNLSYRARRILGSALAWLLSGGQPARIAGTYASLNLAVWLALAAGLWRVLPVRDARSWIAWAGVMFSAGALHSVRLALTDLLAATLFTAAIWLGERSRPRGALALLATAGLARETVLAGIVALWRGPWDCRRAWLHNGVRAGLVALPLFAWMGYVRGKVGAADQGLGNFTWPIVAWIEKWSETVAEYARHPEFRVLITATLLATFALTVQAAYFLHRPRLEDRWWRTGLSGVAMMALLGTAVWEGHPGAATRVLLPMGIAFAVLAVREGAGWGWILCGSLTAFSGTLALWEVPHDPLEISAGRCAGGSYVAQLDTGWYGTERHQRQVWSWSAGHAALLVTSAPPPASPVSVRLRVRAITPRELEVRQDQRILFRGTISTATAWIELSPAAPRGNAPLRLELHSSAPPVRENDQPGARELGFAVSGVELR